MLISGQYDVILARDDGTPLSLFRTPIPSARDCRIANVPYMYCVCNGRVNINPNRGAHHTRACKAFARLLQEKLPEITCTDFAVNKTVAVSVSTRNITVLMNLSA